MFFYLSCTFFRTHRDIVSTNMFINENNAYSLCRKHTGEVKIFRWQTHLGEDSLGDSGLDFSSSSFKILDIFLPTSSFKFSSLLFIDFRWFSHRLHIRASLFFQIPTLLNESGHNFCNMCLAELQLTSWSFFRLPLVLQKNINRQQVILFSPSTMKVLRAIITLMKFIIMWHFLRFVQEFLGHCSTSQWCEFDQTLFPRAKRRVR